jgi:hypothetical protein
MGAGAERLSGIDDHVQRLRLGRFAPLGPDHDAAVSENGGLVKVSPAVGPVVRDLLRADLDETGSGRGLNFAEVGKLTFGPVDGVLDPTRSVLLLHPSGGKLHQLGEDYLRLVRAAANRQPDHPPGCGSSRTSSSSSTAWRCLRLSFFGITTSRTTTWSPRRRPRSLGRPLPESTTCWPG